MQESNFVGKYFSSEFSAGKKCKDSWWRFTADHKAIQEGNVVGVWHAEEDRFVVKYFNSLANTAEITLEEGRKWNAVNHHTNGAVFHWNMVKIYEIDRSDPSGWTFAIATNGASKFYDTILESIRSQQIPNYEIIFCTENLGFKITAPDVKIIYIGNEKQNWITKKKNEMTKQATYPLICYLHDYIKLEKDWYSGYQKFGHNWDVCLNKILHPNGHRIRDWMSLDHPNYGHTEIPYNVMDITHRMYVSGSYWCAWKEFMLRWPLNENLVHRQAEDSEWSYRVRNFWDLRFNPYPTAQCLRYSNV